MRGTWNVLLSKRSSLGTAFPGIQPNISIYFSDHGTNESEAELHSVEMYVRMGSAFNDESLNASIL